ncbi:trehalose/maltose hydrolase-like predicted phosphorylase [Gelidibacter algens]|uniref:Trehalose/maltose hydrolase-like predicted phosphorylase n=1 Tax=Gelidibacter algens TaxID=49280 RepID=A0A1A7R4F2_9FLAO|nr:glycoside hydrolase family 65 protein [Gelidibacter algens]OBX26731.1 glycosyl hydrolase family 65 [Gelidibacter algens]RAJ22827.1 trehalose/maltose hydrolase-like predicted phosphorylase [Gelidibacter algens]
MKTALSLLICLISISTHAQNEGWNIKTTTNSNYTGVAMANGRIGILPSDRLFETEQIILNNVYDKESPLGVSRILKGMNFGNLEMEIDNEKLTAENIKNWSQTLHMKEAYFETSFTYMDKADISYKIYALRNVPYSGYFDFTITAKKDILVKVTGIIETPEEYLEPLSTYRVLKDNEVTMPILQTVAKSRLGRHVVGTSATFVWHQLNSGDEHQRPPLVHEKISEYNNQLSFVKSVKKGTSLDFAWTAAQCTTQDFNDPQSESERFVIFNLLTPKNDLINQHTELWKQLWEGDIIIEGDLQSQLDVRLALYHLYAFARGDSNLSIAPMGLSSQNYNGHIFWDTELWMFPPLLVLNQDIARSLVNYRSDRLDKAKQKAINFGYKGAMFPWESDDTGEEATPAWALTGTFEHHITSDVAIAFWNYYLVTKDKSWLKERGHPMLKEVADYWVSRATLNADGSYSIKNVVGANEFAPNVDDNAFTNGAAITALNYAEKSAKELGLAANPMWADVASKIKIYRFPDGTTMEHSKYKGERIKQADVNLLTFPLDIISDEATILKDLKYYEPKLAEEGPAMGKSVFAVIYARLGDADNAFRLFKESYEPNKRPPFGALSETATGHDPYFATGAGGMLQTVLFGFGGLHLTEDGIIQKGAILPKQWTSLTIKGVGIDNEEYVIKR